MKFATRAEETAFESGYMHAKRETVMAPPQASAPDFRKNSKGQPEFDSIILTLDHLVDNATGHMNVKMVLSTEDVETALFSLFDYYQERARLVSLRSTLDQLMEYRANPEAGIFLYVVPEATTDRFGNLIVQVVMSTSLFAALTAHPDFGDGSEYILIQKLRDQFVKVLDAVNKARGGVYPPLTFLGLESQLIAADMVAE